MPAQRMRKILIGVAATILAVIGIGAFALSRLDPKDYVDLLDAKVQQATGRELKIDGKVGYSLSLQPTIAAEGVRFQNAPWGSLPDMVTVKRVEIRIALLPLLSGNVEIRGLTLIEPDVLLELGRDGAKNWQFKPKGEKKPPAGSDSGQIDVHKARIENGSVVYRDINAKRETRIGLEQLAFNDSGDKIELKGTAQFNAVPVGLDATVAHGRSLGTAGATGKAQLSLTAPGFKIGAKGAVPIGGGLEGLDLNVAAEVSDWSTFAKLTQGSAVRLPALKAEAAARAKGDALLIDALKATLGKSSATGTVRIGLGEKANALQVQLASPFVDLAELQGPVKAAKPSADGRIFSAEPFALDGLRAIEGKADLHIAKLALRDGKTLSGVSAQASFNRGKIVADPVRIQVDGRELRMRLNADASSGKSIAVNLAVDGQGIPIGALMALVNLSGAPEGGPTDLAIRLNGAGNSMRSLMAGANGDVRIVVGPGRMKTQAINYGADITELLNAINPARKSDPYTELKCAVVRLPIRQGVARVDNSIAAETSKVHVIVGGVIDLRNETLDLGFRPKAVTGLGVGLGGLASLGRLRGSLSDPKVELDAAGAATAAANVGMAVVTGGLSLLGGALVTDSVPDQPCQAALTGVVRAQKAETQQKPGIVDSVVGGVKRIFGR